MYGNNLGAPFMMPNPYMQMPNINPMMARGINNIGAMGGLSRGASMSKAGGLLSGIKGLNWSGMLNNVSKTLGVVKEAIPVVKEVRPMMHNMRSMLKIASVFNDETTTSNSNVPSNLTAIVIPDVELPTPALLLVQVPFCAS